MPLQASPAPPTPVTESTGARDNNFNFLRLLFSSLVIVSHCPELQYGDRSREPLTNVFGTISFGDLAVDSFFILSGFLIVKSWVNRADTYSYIKNRILRIFPGFIVASLICGLLLGPLAGNVPSRYFESFDVAKFVAGMLFLQPPHIPPVFTGSFYADIDGPMYTIAWEFSCYLAVMFFGLAGGFEKRFAWVILTLTAVVALYVQKHSHSEYFKHAAIHLLTMFGFGGGFFLYGRAALKNGRYFWGWGGVCALFLLLLFSWQAVEFNVGLLWGYLCLSFALSSSAFSRWFNRLPDISYGVYLYAWPTTKFILMYYPNINTYILIGITLVISYVMGILSWYCVESQFIALKTSRHARSAKV